MTINRRFLAFLRRKHLEAGLSRRDALMASLGSAIPLMSIGATASPRTQGAENEPLSATLFARPGAPARSLQSKLLEIYSVNDKGAVGDGKTDDTAAINAAILDIHKAGGGEVIFGASQHAYYVKGPILVPSNVVVNLNGQTLIGRGFGEGVMFATAMLSGGRLVRNKESTDEESFVFYSSVRNGVIRQCGIAFDFKNFNISCSIDNVATFEALQFGVFYRCFYMLLNNCSARGRSDPAKAAFTFLGENNLITLIRVSATMESGFLFEGGTTAISMIGCSAEGGAGARSLFMMIAWASPWTRVIGRRSAELSSISGRRMSARFRSGATISILQRRSWMMAVSCLMRPCLAVSIAATSSLTSARFITVLLIAGE